MTPELKTQLGATAPDWMFRLTDQRDLIDAIYAFERALGEPCQPIRNFLAARAEANVHMVAYSQKMVDRREEVSNVHG